jgi:hypothetical protein
MFGKPKYIVKNGFAKEVSGILRKRYLFVYPNGISFIEGWCDVQWHEAHATDNPNRFNIDNDGVSSDRFVEFIVTE